MKFLVGLIGSVVLSLAPKSFACVPQAPLGDVGTRHDALTVLLAPLERCPTTVQEFRRVLTQAGSTFATTMVGNRGFHNPGQGSFSFFETVAISNLPGLNRPVVPGDLLFGHFTTVAGNGALALDQNPMQPGLLIELIAWDFTKEVFNFYELVGSAGGSRWFYRGDSQDIWADVKNLHLTASAQQPIFGNKLRCSGCHIAGGPIMKELAAPNDSWWRKERPLPFGGHNPDGQVQNVMKSMVNPELLQSLVLSGDQKLINGKAWQAKTQAPKVALRPLFCAEEINLESGPESLDVASPVVQVPAGFFVDPLFANATLETSKAAYVKALQALQSRFPETTRLDADHGWLTPVKARADQLAVQKLIAQGLITKEFAADVLAVDMTRPLLSPKRCDLLQVLPNSFQGDWLSVFVSNLKESQVLGAQELMQNLTDADHSLVQYQEQAAAFLDGCRQQLNRDEGVLELVGYLGQVRDEVKVAAISKNPRGQILEPGFRVIFPEFKPVPKPWASTLDAATCKPL